MTLSTTQYPNFQSALAAAISQQRDLRIEGDSHMTAPFVGDIPPNLTAWGRGNRDKVLIDFPTGDAMVLGAGQEERNVLFEDFAIMAGVMRTSGFAVKFPNVARLGWHNVDVGTAEWDDTKWHYGGLAVDRCDDSTFEDTNVYARKTCVRLGSGADVSLDGGIKIQNHKRQDFSDALPGAIGVHVTGGMGGLYSGKCHTIYCGLGWLIEGFNREIFMHPGTVVDSCLDDGIRAMPNSFGTFSLDGVWSASNGRQVDGDGLGIEGPQLPIAILHIHGGRYYNNKRGSGIVVNGGKAFITGPVLNENRDHGLWVPNGSVTGAADPVFATANGKAHVNASAAPGFKVGPVYT